jgi:hypothetical protein
MAPIPICPQNQQPFENKKVLCKELKILYTYHDKVLQYHCHIFTKDINFHSKGDTNCIRQWMNTTNQAVITKSAKDAKTKAIANICIITSYFPNATQNLTLILTMDETFGRLLKIVKMGLLKD